MSLYYHTHRFIPKIFNMTCEIGRLANQGRDIVRLRVIERWLEFGLQTRRVIEQLLSGFNFAQVPLYTAHCTIPQTQSICNR